MAGLPDSALLSGLSRAADSVLLCYPPGTVTLPKTVPVDREQGVHQSRGRRAWRLSPGPAQDTLWDLVRTLQTFVSVSVGALAANSRAQKG